MQGLLRATEPRAGCGPVVLERLYAMSGYRIEAYGPERLAEAGFDLARLYRGAVVTLGRDLPRPELEAALRQAPGALGARAVSRLHERGPEAFEARARGLEGIADTGGKAALGVMTALARQGARGASIRALEILDEMTFGVDNDACDGWMGEGRGSGGSHNPRNVRHLNDHCETRLRDAERGALALEVAPLGRSPDREIREHVAETLGSIGSTKAVPLLQTLARDTWHPEGAQVCGYVGDRAKCHDFFPVREAAADALDAIAHHQEVLRER